MRTHTTLIVTLALLLISLSASADKTRSVRLAQADATAKCDATEILATHEGKGVDPKLAKFKGQLSREPFTAWDTFKFLHAVTLQLALGKEQSAPLVPGGTLTLTLKDKKVAAGKARLSVGVTVAFKQKSLVKSSTLTFDSGQTEFPFAGMKYDNGTYILALGCQ